MAECIEFTLNKNVNKTVNQSINQSVNNNNRNNTKYEFTNCDMGKEHLTRDRPKLELRGIQILQTSTSTENIATPVYCGSSCDCLIDPGTVVVRRRRR